MPQREPDPQVLSLIEQARAKLQHAHAPYSNFPVAAAVVDEHGRVFTGVNVENASFGLTMCAERVAIFSAVAAGSQSITAVAVTAKRLRPVSPCGACRQVMQEFCSPGTPVYSDAGLNAYVEWTVRGLLPSSFSATDLETAPAQDLPPRA